MFMASSFSDLGRQMLSAGPAGIVSILV